MKTETLLKAMYIMSPSLVFFNARASPFAGYLKNKLSKSFKGPSRIIPAIFIKCDYFKWSKKLVHAFKIFARSMRAGGPSSFRCYNSKL